MTQQRRRQQRIGQKAAHSPGLRARYRRAAEHSRYSPTAHAATGRRLHVAHHRSALDRLNRAEAAAGRRSARSRPAARAERSPSIGAQKVRMPARVMAIRAAQARQEEQRDSAHVAAGDRVAARQPGGLSAASASRTWRRSPKAAAGPTSSSAQPTKQSRARRASPGIGDADLFLARRFLVRLVAIGFHGDRENVRARILCPLDQLDQEKEGADRRASS